MFPNASYTNSPGRFSQLYQQEDQSFLDQDHFFDLFTEKDDPERLEAFYLVMEEEADSASLAPDLDDKIEDNEEFLFYAADDTDPDFDVDDSIALYLKEISRIPLLSAEEEVHLAKAIERGKKAVVRLSQAHSQTSGLSRDRLRSEVRRGKEARRKLIEANFRLVVSIAKKYIGHGVSFMDLIQEGNIGLIRAVEKFDYRKGFKFSTYAVWWIRQSLARALADKGRTIRLPVHIAERLHRVQRAERRFVLKYARDPTHEELAEELGLTVEEVEIVRGELPGTVSLHAPVGDDEAELGDFLEDRASPTPFDETAAVLDRHAIDSALENLPGGERRVIQMRFGLDGQPARTMHQVARELKLSADRVRRLEEQALRKLRQLPEAQALNAA